MEPSADESRISDDSEDSYASSGSYSDLQPKKFTGAQSTWRQVTYEERQVAASLAQLRAQDLSIHLYNAHAMKQRQYIPNVIEKNKLKPWARKERWRGKNEASEAAEEGERFVAPKIWTAWPLPPELVPRSGESVGIVDEDEIYTLKRAEVLRPSRELEDILTGITLRIAKERFEKRDWESPHLEREELPSNMPSSSTEQTTAAAVRDPIQIDQGTVMHDGKLKDFSEPPKKEADFQHPIVSADDERSRRLMRPTVRHNLAKLDELLMGLHYARQTCIEYDSDQTGSQIEEENLEDSDKEVDEKPTPPTHVLSRPRGRPRKELVVPDDADRSVVESCGVPKVTRRGRPKKVHVPFPGETQNEMLVRLARNSKKPLPFQSETPRNSPPPPKPNSKRAKRENSRTGSQVKRSERSTRLGLRDWSEVLGTAGLVGFSPDVIARATQRCATLFGEGMAMRVLFENPQDEDILIDYVPVPIPNLSSEISSESDTRAPRDKRKAKTSRKRNRRSKSAGGEAATDQGSDRSELEDQFWCHDISCPRHNLGFNRKSNLISHLMKIHRLEAHDAEKAADTTFDDEMVGGVHVDGYLRYLRGKPGWRGGDSTPRKSNSRTRVRSNVETTGNEFQDASSAEGGRKEKT